jgi:uncharacterized protein (DUF924 family)
MTNAFDPSYGTPSTVEQAVAFWRYWSMKGWFHPDDTYEDQDFNNRVVAAWAQKDPWDDDMTPLWDAAISHHMGS